MKTNLTKKDIASVLYKYYLDKYCEDDFCFDNGQLKQKVISQYEKLKKTISEKELLEIENDIKFREEEGTNYNTLYFTYSNMPDMFLQVTSLIDYDGNKVDGYTGDNEFADVGMFFVNYIDVDFNDLN